MHDYRANGGCGLPGVEEGTGEKCGEAAERFAGNSSLSEGLVTCKGKKAIFTVSNHSENETNGTGSTKRRSEFWIHLIWSYGCGVMRCRRSGTNR